MNLEVDLVVYAQFAYFSGHEFGLERKIDIAHPFLTDTKEGN